MSDLVENPENRFSCVAANVTMGAPYKVLLHPARPSYLLLHKKDKEIKSCEEACQSVSKILYLLKSILTSSLFFTPNSLKKKKKIGGHYTLSETYFQNLIFLKSPAKYYCVTHLISRSPKLTQGLYSG